MNQYSRLYTFFFFILCFTCIPKQAQAQCDPRRDSLALVALFDSTGGNNWTNKTNWKVVGQPISTWYGITTDAGGCVTCIDLDGLIGCMAGGVGGNNLVGILPLSLDSLKNLQTLFLSNNKLSGSIPNFTFPNLQTLFLINNQFGGSLPNFNLPNLVSLYAYDNKLVGNIPNFNLPNLRDLLIGANQLNGNIPNFNLSNLQTLDISSNQLIGTVPNFNLPKLRDLYIGNNQITGDVPNFNLPNLQILGLSANKLSGNIPNFNIPNLRSIYLTTNLLNGSIPNFNLPNLQDLILNNNQLSGDIPNFNTPNLRNLQLFANQLSGNIPIFNMPNMQNLFLSNNRLTGSIPNFNMPNLLRLYADSNQLSGNIPLITATSGFQCQSNKFTFQDFLPNLPLIPFKTYNPQDSIFKDTTYNRTLNDPLSINLNIDDTVTTNIYKWYKNNVLYRTVTGVNKLVFNALQATDAGVYRCEVTNPNAPLLTLYSRNATVKVVSLCRERDSLALVDLYNSTGGANWTNKWNLLQPINNWYGIKLNVNGCVQYIDFSGIFDTVSLYLGSGGNNLVGTIPNSITNLSELEMINMSSNKLTGSLPNSVWNLSKLKILNLYNNQSLSTPINSQIGQLRNLKILDLGFTNVNSTIPDEIYDLAELRRLWMPVSNLKGVFSNKIGRLTKLQDISIRDNQLTGNVPDSLWLSKQFLKIAINGNSFNTWQLPNAVSSISNLNFLDIQFTNVYGSIPMGMAQLNGLRTFFFTGNKIDYAPNFSTIPLTLAVAGNRLTFDDLLPNIIRIPLSYSPQDSIFKDTTYQNTEGGILTINLGIDDTVTTNVYKWYKNNVFIDSIVGSNKRIFNNIRLADAGVWTCRVTNPNAPLLTLFSRKATLKVLQTPPPTLTLFKDSLVLIFMDNILAISANSTNIKVHGIETGFRTGTFTVQGAKVVFRPTTPFNTGEEIMVTVKSVFTASGSILSNCVIKKHIPVTVRSNPNFISLQFTGLQTAATHDGGSVYAADLNRDGRVDLIQASGYYGLNIPYTIQLQNVDGSFSTSQTITSNTHSGVGSLADLNNDGYPDLTVASNLPSEFKVYLNDKTGHFSTGTSYTLPPFNDALTYGDVDGDGDIDLVSSAGLVGGTNYIGVAKNNGNGIFQTVVQYSIDPTFGNWVHLNDMDGDGDLDILLQGSNSFSKTPLIIFFENDGQGNFVRGQQYGSVNSGGGVIRDYNNDGKLDLLTFTDSLRLFLGNGNMTLQTPHLKIDTTVLPYTGFFGDFNGDNSHDFMIVTKTTNFRPLRLYSNNGVGNFSLQQLCLALDGAGAVSDINNDGKLDIAYWSVDSKKTFVVYQVPTIDSFKQDSICMGKTYRLPTGRIVSVAGIYLDTFRSNIGCDSIRFTTNLKVIPLTIPINRTICSNDSIKINGKWYSQRRPSGRDTLKTVGSCDSVFIVNLSFKPPTDAIDDNVIVNETNVTEFTVTDNDRFDASAQLNIRLLKKPQYGTLTALGNDKFRYESLPILRGVTQMFTYLLCNTLCPNECDSAQVTIDIQGLSPVVKNSKGITPQNHDGKNDVLEFDETEDLTRYPESELIIYNRWNDIVFRAKPYLNNWDGSRNGQPLPAGTYYYILHLNQREGKTLTGDVTIIR